VELWLEVQGQKVKVEAQLLNQQLWVHFKGKTFVVDMAAGKKGTQRGGPSASSDVVKAPMPGKLTKILIKVGDLVAKGQTVLVMEAMKMEYTLKAEISGKVKSIEAQVGDQVQLGKKLVILDPGTKA
jgi:biotin carboxyl carrier protein